MSEESNIFLEMVRSAIKPEPELSFARYCYSCDQVTNHISRQEENWETLICPCGVRSSYKIK